MHTQSKYDPQKNHLPIYFETVYLVSGEFLGNGRIQMVGHQVATFRLGGCVRERERERERESVEIDFLWFATFNKRKQVFLVNKQLIL